LPARIIICIVLGLWLHTETSWGQSEPAKQVVGANPTGREEKKGSLTIDDKGPAETQKKSSVVVRHLDKKQDGYKVAETTHFRILHDQGKPIVEKIGEAAEMTRALVQRKWFGEEATDWDGKCSIYLHANREKYSAKTGMKNTLGHMRTLDWGGVFLRSIHLPCQEPNLVADVLPHEVSHSVMAIRFQGRTPRWADEGMAMLAETPESVQECVDRLPRYRKKDALFAVEVLMQTEEADQLNTMEYYSQSTSLVQFLTARKSPQAFTQFLRTYVSKGAEPALKQHYGIQGYADLEQRWQTFAFGEK
jgi:hypothetical protein